MTCATDRRDKYLLIHYGASSGALQQPPITVGSGNCLTGVRRNGTPPSTTVTFAELPAPKQVSRNVAERCATLHIGSASLDIYSGCDAEQLKMLVELLRLC